MTGTNKTAVFNRALAHLGQDPVENLVVSEMGAAGRKMLVFVEAARDAVLRAHHWTMAMRYVQLERLDTASTWRYPYAFAMPNDALRLTQVDTPGYAWEQGVALDAENLETVVVWSEHPGPLPVAYIRRLGWDVMGEDLVAAIALRLAALACLSITGDEDRESKLDKRALQAVAAAMGQEGSQQGGQEPLGIDPYGQLRNSAH